MNGTSNGSSVLRPFQKTSCVRCSIRMVDDRKPLTETRQPGLRRGATYDSSNLGKHNLRYYLRSCAPSRILRRTSSDEDVRGSDGSSICNVDLVGWLRDKLHWRSR